MTEEQKISQNLKAVDNAVAQQRLEGLEVPPDVVEEMKRAAKGEVEIEEGIRNTVRRFTHGKVRGERPLL
ncbi:MAG: antitoxin [Syntrophobacteraceae bacterium]